jgi:hypothetical protein
MMVRLSVIVLLHKQLLCPAIPSQAPLLLTRLLPAMSALLLPRSLLEEDRKADYNFEFHEFHGGVVIKPERPIDSNHTT